MRLRAAACSAAALLALAAIAPQPARAAVVKVTPATFRAALAAAQDGDTLVLRSGVYKGTFERSDITNLTITGRGRVIFENDPDNDDTGIIFKFTNVDGLTIERLTIRNSEDDGIHLYDCSNFVARKLRIDKCSDSGIEDENTQGYLVEKCRISRCSWGLALGYSGGATGVIVRGNRFSQMESYGVQLNADDALVERNAFSGGDGKGIAFRGTRTNATITRNTLIRTGDTAIEASGSAHIMTKNKVVRGGGSGIVLGGNGGHTCTENTAISCAAGGIRVTSTGNTISRNVGRNNEPFDLDSTEPEDQNTYDANQFGTENFGLGGA